MYNVFQKKLAKVIFCHSILISASKYALSSLVQSITDVTFSEGFNSLSEEQGLVSTRLFINDFYLKLFVKLKAKQCRALKRNDTRLLSRCFTELLSTRLTAAFTRATRFHHRRLFPAYSCCLQSIRRASA